CAREDYYGSSSSYAMDYW
nr:immunoglobulin heavy chain junction region [Mus musculus]NSM08859.1 immunoglobulin heavy chain junction region [Mus musculus]